MPENIVQFILDRRPSLNCFFTYSCNHVKKPEFSAELCCIAFDFADLLDKQLQIPDAEMLLCKHEAKHTSFLAVHYYSLKIAYH